MKVKDDSLKVKARCYKTEGTAKNHLRGKDGETKHCLDKCR